MEHKILQLQKKMKDLEKARRHYDDYPNYKEIVHGKHNEEFIRDIVQILISLDERVTSLEGAENE